MKYKDYDGKVDEEKIKNIKKRIKEDKNKIEKLQKMKYKNYNGRVVDIAKVELIKSFICDHQYKIECFEKMISKVKEAKANGETNSSIFIGYESNGTDCRVQSTDLIRFIDSILDWYAYEIGQLENADITKREEK